MTTEKHYYVSNVYTKEYSSFASKRDRDLFIQIMVKNEEDNEFRNWEKIDAEDIKQYIGKTSRPRFAYKEIGFWTLDESEEQDEYIESN